MLDEVDAADADLDDLDPIRDGLLQEPLCDGDPEAVVAPEHVAKAGHDYPHPSSDARS